MQWEYLIMQDNNAVVCLFQSHKDSLVIYLINAPQKEMKSYVTSLNAVFDGH